MFEVRPGHGRLVAVENRSRGWSRQARPVRGQMMDPQQETSGTEAGAVPPAAPDAVDASPATEALSDAERGERLAQLNSIIELMRPAVQADGGDLALLSADVATGIVEVQLQGACSSCAVSSSTLQGGVDRILRDRLAWVTEVRGGVDESVDPFESESMGRGGYVPSF
jgi:Fe-S cluster biogenesis protein NfuA